MHTTPAACLIAMCITLNFDLLTPESMNAEWLPCTVRLPSLVLIAQAVFPSRALTHRQTDTKLQMQVISLPIARLSLHDMGSYQNSVPANRMQGFLCSAWDKPQNVQFWKCKETVFCSLWAIWRLISVKSGLGKTKNRFTLISHQWRMH